MHRKILAQILFLAIAIQALPLNFFKAGKPALADSVNANFTMLDSAFASLMMYNASFSSNLSQKVVSDKFLVRGPSDTAPIFVDSRGLNFQGSTNGYYVGYDWGRNFGLGYWSSTRSGAPFTSVITINKGVGISLQDKVTLTGAIVSKDPSVTVPNVLAADYSLATIDEISTYAKLTKSLPGYPTPADIQSNGLELAKTNALLLKKVEELTLYVIQLNDRIKVLESK